MATLKALLLISRTIRESRYRSNEKRDFLHHLLGFHIEKIPKMDPE